MAVEGEKKLNQGVAGKKSLKERWTAEYIERFRKDKAADPFDLEKEFPEFKGWEAIGFHRSLGQELWQIVVEQINNALYLFIMVYLFPIIRPFPEIDGYLGIEGGILAIFYLLFDVGTNFGINRFIAEYRVSNPRKMLMYVSFYVKYQMLTGVIQITLLSFFTFQVIEYSNYAYLTWILLINLQKQWPGMLHIFKTVLSGMQHHAKVELLNLLQGEIVERITLIGFVIYGRWLGETNPAIGIIMGICIFTNIGNYIDDIIFGIISARVTDNLLKKYVGISLKEIFRIKIDKDVYKEMLSLGVQASVLPAIGTALGTTTLLLTTQNIPGYVTWNSLIGYGNMFSSIAGQYGDFGLQTMIAESYSNGKKALAEFYVSYSMRWQYFFRILISITLLSVIPYFTYLIENTSALNYYRGATMFFIPLLLVRLAGPFFSLPGPIIVGARKITQSNILSAIGMGIGYAQTFLFILVFRVQDLGFFGMFYLLGLGSLHPSSLIMLVINYWYVKKKVLNVKIFWRATFIGPTIAALPVFLLTQTFYHTLFRPMLAAIGVESTIAVAMGLLALILIFMYFPLSMLFGFDDYMFSQLRQSINLAGPSKPIFLIVYKLMKPMRNLAIKIGTWKRPGWSIPYEEAHQQVRELMELKRQSKQKNQ
nr:hypothetical protein [Candidatus Sigynarchaeota archaeon]